MNFIHRKHTGVGNLPTSLIIYKEKSIFDVKKIKINILDRTTKITFILQRCEFGQHDRRHNKLDYPVFDCRAKVAGYVR